MDDASARTPPVGGVSLVATLPVSDGALPGHAELLRRLAQADQHSAIGARAIDGLRHVVAALECEGHDATQARKLLATFEEVQSAQQADRDRIAAELAKLDRH